MINHVIAHFQDGRVLRGQTMDFMPAKDRFHVILAEAGTTAKPVEVMVADLKGVFFVKSLEGNRQRKKSNAYTAEGATLGRKIQVLFKDGEVLNGYTQIYQPGRAGFFVTPADKGSNTDRVYVVASATEEITLPRER